MDGFAAAHAGLHPAAAAVVGGIVGAVVGSFLALVLIRWPQGRQVVSGRSACDACDAPLAARDLIPVVSFLVLHGRCRRCGQGIDRRHPLIEALAALIGLLAFSLQPGWVGAVSALLGWWLLLLAALDADHFWLPDRLTLPLIPAGLATALAGIGPPLLERVVGAAIGFTCLAAIAFLYRHVRGRIGLGGGDPKLFAAIGAWVGWSMLPGVLLAATLLGLLMMALLTMVGQRFDADSRLPLGTLLAIAAWVLWLVVINQI